MSVFKPSLAGPSKTKWANSLRTTKSYVLIISKSRSPFKSKTIVISVAYKVIATDTLDLVEGRMSGESMFELA